MTLTVPSCEGITHTLGHESIQQSPYMPILLTGAVLVRAQDF